MKSFTLHFSLLILSLVYFGSCSSPVKSGDASDTSRYQEIHEKLLTIDTHTDTPMNFSRDTFDMSKIHDPFQTSSRVDLPRMKKGGLDAVFLAVFVGQGERTEEGNARARAESLQILDSIDAMLDRNSKLASLALSPEEINEIVGDGKSAILIGLENGYPIGDDISFIETLYKRGARYITLCHTHNNDICDSSTDSVEFNGLSALGVKVVQEMNRLGIMIDVSHASDSTFYDVIRLSQVPVIASHSSARSVCNNPRNLSDDMLRALAKNGGVAQVCLLSEYVKTPQENTKRDSARAAVVKKYGDYYKLDKNTKPLFLKEWYDVDKYFPPVLANISDLCDHIDHIVEVAGIDHVGIGSDFDGGGGLSDCFDVSRFPLITKELLKRGYTENDLSKIWGGNSLRVFTEVMDGAENGIEPDDSEM